MYPRGAELHERQGGEQRSERVKEAAEGAGEDSQGYGRQESLDEEAGEAAEVCSYAAIAHEKTVDGAEGGCHGARLPAGGLEAVPGDAYACAAFRISGLLVESDGFVGGGGFVLDHGEDGVDRFEGVLELFQVGAP